MNHLFKSLMHLFTIPKKHLLLIDGDNVSPAALKSTINNCAMGINVSTEVFCNCISAPGWIKVRDFDDAVYYLVKTEAQAADLKLKSRIIQILANYSSYNFTHIYLATNDHTFKSDISSLSKLFPTSVISSSSHLLSIPNITAIPIATNTEVLNIEEKKLIQNGDCLAQVGSLLKSNGIVYECSLSKFLRSNGFVVEKDTVTKTPTIN
jgi:hypothetical protein